MRAQEFIVESALTEAATAIVYHYAGVSAAASILTSGVFQLSSITGNKSEEQYSMPGYPYFLSTTRSKVGDYHRYAGSSAVMFVLDGNWLNQRYKTKAVDYWDRSWNYPGSPRTSESEDRVFSKTSEMSIGGVTAVHVLIKEQSEYRSPEVRTILISAKKRGIATYLYTDEDAWRLQNTRRAVTPGQAAPLLKGQQPKGYTPSRPPTIYLEAWMELIYKKNKAELSPRAEKLRHDLVYYGSRYPNEDSGLGTDMSNARKPSSTDYPTAVKINEYMRQNKIPNTVALKNAMVAKWDKPVTEDDELDEDWKSKLGNAAIAGAIGVGGGAGIAAKDAYTDWANNSGKPTTAQVAPSTVKPAAAALRAAPQATVKAPAVKAPTVPTAKATPRANQPLQIKPVTNNPAEAILIKTAIANGIRGTELAAFMAQCAHETLDFKRLIEFGGSLDFRKYDPKYAPNKAKSLGNKKIGDGARYKGRGYIQLTGRYNYKMAGQELGLPLEKHPEMVEDPKIAAQTAVWFWKHRVQPNVDNFGNVNDVTKQINPAMRGLDDRKQNFADYMQVASNSFK